jgi:Na+/serine symporter
MTNKFEHIVETVGKDIWAVVKYLPEHLRQTEKVIQTVIKDSPTVRQDVVTLVQKVSAIDALVAKDIAEKGLSIPDDLATLTAVKDLVAYIRGQFWQDMSSAYKELQTDAK